MPIRREVARRPAKITIQVLEPIDLHTRFGSSPDVDAIYEAVTGSCNERSTSWPPSGAGR